MVKETIRIYARLKPTKYRTALFEIENDQADGSSIVQFVIPKEFADGFVNNKKEFYKFKFQNVFNQDIQQDVIFKHVAQPVVDSVLAGYNGTIFAYGQTGSGKTFTITGGAEKYADRGIIPRTLSYIFQEFSKNPDCTYTVQVSYLEIYNENGYDLLDSRHEAAKMEDLPKVTLLEDPDQNIHLKNLSLQQATNEEEALNFLFVGDTNRMIAETPMNQASTRSHCIFTIHLTSRQIGSTSLRKSKLHLVDLAGSERVAKSGANGLLLTEAKYINLSLHYLEQVIVALSEKNRSHIPYRNSMMTSVLRDSLGGNCMTSMIATCAVDKNNIDESISTCRFAQRVALIKNEAILNEEFDPKLLISKLKKEVNQLKEELALRTGDIREDELTSEEVQQCIDLVNQYLEDSDLEAVLDVGADMRKIQKCFDILKKRLEEQTARFQSETRSKETNATNHQDLDVSPYFSAEESKLKNIIMQRDNEISILVNMLKKEKQKNAELENNSRQKRHLTKESSFHTSPNSSQTSLQENSFTSEENINPDNIVAYSDTWIDQSKSFQRNKENITHRQIYAPAQKRTHQKYNAARHRPRWTKKMKIDVVRCYFRAVVNAPTSCRRSMYRYWKQLYPDTTYTEQRIANQKRQIFSHVDNINRHSKKGRWLTKLEVEAIKMGPMSLGRQEAFDIFCQDYKDNNAIKMKKAELKEQYSKAKSLGEQVNKSRIRINVKGKVSFSDITNS